MIRALTSTACLVLLLTSETHAVNYRCEPKQIAQAGDEGRLITKSGADLEKAKSSLSDNMSNSSFVFYVNLSMISFEGMDPVKWNMISPNNVSGRSIMESSSEGYYGPDYRYLFGRIIDISYNEAGGSFMMHRLGDGMIVTGLCEVLN